METLPNIVNLSSFTANRFGHHLPLRKELSARYGACPATVAKALGRLVATGILRREGRRLICGCGAPPARSRIVLLTDRDSLDSSTPQGRHGAELASALEQECATAHIAFSIEILNSEEPAAYLRASEVAAPRRGDTGFVVNLCRPLMYLAKNRLFDIVRAVCVSGALAAIFDALGGLDENDARSLQAGARIFCMSERAPGRAAAMLAVRLGHQNAAFISGHGRQSYSVNRLAGAGEILEEHGGSITAFESDFMTNIPLAAVALCGLPFDRAAAFFLPFVSAQALAEIPARTEAYAATIPPGIRNSSRVREFVRLTAQAAALCAGGIPALLREGIRAALYQDFCRIAGALFLDPLFEAALREKDITFWICSNDAVADSAVRFLHGCGKRVPGDISVSGFDNSPLSAENRLMSYDFAITGIARSLLAYAGGRPEEQERGSMTEVEGFMVERESTGPVCDTAQER